MRKQLNSVAKLIAALLGFGFVGAATEPAQAQQTTMVLQCNTHGAGMSLKNEIDCACQAALEANTIEALEGFLAKYGDQAEADSACLALATTALIKFGSSGGDHGLVIIHDESGYGG